MAFVFSLLPYFGLPAWFRVSQTLALLSIILAKIRVIHADAGVGAASAEKDHVHSLPGYDGPLPSDWYSGYLEYHLPCMDNKLIHTHYMYIKKQKGSNDNDVNGNDYEDNNGHSSKTYSQKVSPNRDLENKEDPTKGKNNDDDLNRNSTNNDAPLVFWSNGGPGASSLFGLFTEIGPFQLNENSLQTESYKQSGIPTLFPNEDFSWNKIGDLLIFDAPAPVGYSYCDDKVNGDGLSCGGWDDESSAWNNYHALLAFYEKFPDVMKQPLYLTGESYAGIYIPSLARKILENHDHHHVQRDHQNDDDDNNRNDYRLRSPSSSSSSSSPIDNKYFSHGNDEDSDRASGILGVPNSIRLKGFAVGDACVGSDINCSAKQPPYFDLFFFAGHGQISLKLYNEILNVCGIEKLQTFGATLSKECQALIAKGYTQVGGFFEYSLYDDCTYSNGLLQQQQYSPLYHGTPNVIKQTATLTTKVSGALNDYVCGGGPALDEYVIHPKVKEALHVSQESSFFEGDNGVGFNYSFTEKNLMPFYLDVVTGKYAQEGIRVVVYNGDTDPSINSFAAQNWTSNLGLDEVEEWRPWTIDSCRRMGGFVTRYEGSFDYVTIRGAGHMVPTYKPAAAFSFLKSWVENSDYPPFNSSCKHP